MKTSLNIKTLIAVVVALNTVPVHANNNTWSTSANDGSWATAANWTTAPASTDNIIFGSAATTTITTASRTINNITYNSGAPSYTIIGTGTLTLTGNGINDSSANAETFGVNIQQNSGSSANTIATMGANNGALIFNGTYDFNSAVAQTSTLAFGSTTGNIITFNGNLINTNGTPGAGNLTLTQSGSGNGTVILNGVNSGLTGTITLGNNLAAKLGSSGAVASGATITSGSNLSTVWLASDSAINSFGLNYTANSTSEKSTVIVDRATPGAGLTTQNLASLSLGNQTTTTFIGGSNITSGTPTITVTGTTTFGQAGSSNIEILNAQNVNLSLGNVSSASGATTGKSGVLVLDGNTTGNTVTGVIANGASGGTVSSALSSSTAQSITLASATGFTTGMTISGSGIAAGTVITGISSNTLTLSQAPTSPSGTITGTTALIANLSKAGSGTWALTGANTYTGATSVNGGTLKLDFANSSTTSNILYNGYTTSGTGVLPTLTVSGGTLLLAGKAGTSNSQSFGALAPASGFPFAGAGEITLVAGAGGTITLNLSSITTSGTSSTGLLDFNIGVGGTVNVATTNSGFVGTGVTYGGENQFAYYAGSSGNRQIVAATNSNYSQTTTITPGFTGNASTSAFYFLTGSMTQTSGTNFGFGGFRITNTANSDTLNLNTGTLTGNNGNILYAGGFDNNYTITNGTITNPGFGGALLVTVASGGGLTIASTTNIADNGAGAELITKVGGGTLTVLGAKTFAGSSNGAVNVVSGTYSFDTIANGGTSSGLGASSNAASNLFIGGALQYIGSGGSTDRSFTIMGTGATIDSSGSGALTWAPASALAFANTTNGVSFKPAQDQFITFTGTSTAANTFGSSLGVLADPTQGLLYVSKTGVGTWIFSGANTYTGGTTITGGTLKLATGGTVGASTGALNVSTGTFDLNGVNSTVGTLTLGGTGTIAATSSGTLTTSMVTANGAGNVINSGATVIGPVTINGGLKVSGMATGTVAVAGTGTLAGAGTTGAVTVKSGGAINLTDGLIGTLTVGGLSITSGALTFDIGAGSSSNLDLIQDNGAFVLGGTTTITIGYVSGSPALAAGTYNLIAYTGSLSGTLSNLSLSTTSLGGSVLSLVQGANSIQLKVTNTTGTSYTLTANAGATVLHSGALTSVSNTITNTGTSTADTLNYTGLGVTTSSGTLNDTPSSGGPVANLSGTATNTGTFTAGSTGTTVTVGPVVTTATNATLGGSATLTGTTNASIVVYTGQGVWNTAGSGSWGTASASQTAWTAAGGTPGLDAGFTNTDSATFGTVSGNNSATVSLNGSNPSLNAITFSTSGGGYTLAQGSSGSFTLSNSGSLSAAITDSGTNSASNTISAPIVLASNLNATITDASDTLTISGTVSGSKSVTKNGAGKLILSGNNTYTNGTTVNTGTLVVGTSTTVTGSTIQSGAVGTGTLTLASGSTLQDNGTAITLANAVSVSGTITFSSTGAGSLTFDGRNLTTPSVFTLTGNTILVVNNTTTIDDNIAGNFTLTKQGNGTLNLLGTSSSTAGTTITSGSITIANGASLGSGLISLANGTGLTYTGGAGTLNQNITVASGATGTVSNTGTATLTLAGTLTKADANLILNAGGHTIDVTGAIVSTGATGTFDSDLYATNGTIIADNSNNSYSGPTHIYGNGTLVNGFNNALPTSTVIELGNSGGPATETGAAYTNIYQLNGHNQSIAGLTSANPAGFTDSNHLIGGSATLSTLTLTGTASLGEGILGGTGTNANNLAVKFNPGSGKTITLSGSNTYTGGTEVVDGNLLVNNTTGSATGGGTFKLDSGAGLSGTGTITSTSNTVNGNVTVGSGGTNTTDVLTMTASGTTTFSGANLTFNLDANSTNSNVMALGNTPSIYFGNGVTTLTLNLLGTGTTNIASGTDYILFTASSASDYKDLTFSGSKITNFVLTLTGTASNSAANSLYYGQSYLILSGNNIEIQVVPEPGTWALMLGGLALLVAFQRVRRSRNS